MHENPSKRQTFKYICKELKENPEFIINGVDANKFKKYTELIKSYQSIEKESNGTGKTTQNDKESKQIKDDSTDS